VGSRQYGRIGPVHARILTRGGARGGRTRSCRPGCCESAPSPSAAALGGKARHAAGMPLPSRSGPSLSPPSPHYQQPSASAPPPITLRSLPFTLWSLPSRPATRTTTPTATAATTSTSRAIVSAKIRTAPADLRTLRSPKNPQTLYPFRAPGCAYKPPCDRMGGKKRGVGIEEPALPLHQSPILTINMRAGGRAGVGWG
jgi:hypothetical protein